MNHRQWLPVRCEEPLVCALRLLHDRPDLSGGHLDLVLRLVGVSAGCALRGL